MNYWVVKGNSARNDWSAILRPGNTGKWRTKRPPKLWENGDRIFFWESTPKLRIVAIGNLVDTNCGKSRSGDKFYRVKYLTRQLASMPAINELRRFPILSKASFLKTGPAVSVFPLTEEQGQFILQLLASRNPAILKIWVAKTTKRLEAFIADLDFSASEGRPKLICHLRRERNPQLAAHKKAEVLRRTGKLQCEVCDFDFEKVFGKIGKGFCEIHHKKPLSERTKNQKTKATDLSVLCSNCHRIIHRTEPIWSISKLRSHLQK
jgi:predicted HNH restriction endonuclease